jgi:hypothetical protein
MLLCMDEVPNVEAMSVEEQAALYDQIVDSYAASPRSHRYRDETGRPLSRAERRRRKIREPLPAQEMELRQREAQQMREDEISLELERRHDRREYLPG